MPELKPRQLEVPLGGRLYVFGDVPSMAMGDAATALDAWDGAGAVVIAGQPIPVGQLSAALEAFDDVDGRQLVWLQDSTIDVTMTTAMGPRCVEVERVEPAGRDAARESARLRVSQGGGLVVIGSGGGELTALGLGFFAAPGTERSGRSARGDVWWVEVEASAELHARLAHSGQDGDALLRHARVRRRAAAAIAVAGVLNVASALTPPLEFRLRILLRLVPLAVPQAATALVALSGLALLVLARGIRRGDRRSARVAMLLLVGSVVGHLLKGVDVEEAVVAALVTGYLVAHRHSFAVRAGRPSARGEIVLLGGAVAGVVLAAAAAIEIVTAARGHRVPLGAAAAGSLERLVGSRDVVLSDRIDDFVGPALMGVGFGSALWAATLLVRPAGPLRASHDELFRARAVLARWGSGTLDYFALREDKEFFLYGDTLVAYAVRNGVCLVSPDPIGPDHQRDDAWAAFRSFVDHRGWTLAVLGAGEAWLPIYAAGAMHELYVGDEAVVDVHRFSLDGGRRKGLRQAVNRIARYGYTISFHDPAHADETLRAAVRDVMTKSRRGDVERGFSMTLGRIFEPADVGLLLAVCHGADGAPVAFCQYVPAPGIDGYSLDLMRRDSGEHPNGLLDFVIVETILHLRREGHSHLGLNFATMRAVLAGETDSKVVARIERWALQHMSGSMQIESLWRFSAKFEPDWQPRYVVYDAREHVVAVAFAIARAESFWELPVIGRFLVPSAVAPRRQRALG